MKSIKRWKGVISVVLGFLNIYSPSYGLLVWEYHVYNQRCLVHWRNTMSTPWGHHDECVCISGVNQQCSVHQGFHTNSFVFLMNFPTFSHDILSVYSWYPLGILTTSKDTHNNPPLYYHIPHGVLNISSVLYTLRCTVQTIRMVSLSVYDVCGSLW